MKERSIFFCSLSSCSHLAGKSIPSLALEPTCSGFQSILRTKLRQLALQTDQPQNSWTFHSQPVIIGLLDLEIILINPLFCIQIHSISFVALESPNQCTAHCPFYKVRRPGSHKRYLPLYIFLLPVTFPSSYRVSQPGRQQWGVGSCSGRSCDCWGKSSLLLIIFTFLKLFAILRSKVSNSCCVAAGNQVKGFIDSAQPGSSLTLFEPKRIKERKEVIHTDTYTLSEAENGCTSFLLQLLDKKFSM